MLVATDIAARGIHVDDIELVIHVDPPTEHKAYLHRSGRTARAGATGNVVTVATGDQMREVATLTRKAAIAARTTSVAPGASAIVELTGPPADKVTPRAIPVDEPQAGTRSRRNPTGQRPATGQRSSSVRSASGRSTPTRRGRRGGANGAGGAGKAGRRVGR